MWTLPEDTNLSNPHPLDFEFLPDIGFRYRGGGGSIIIAATSITKPDIKLTDEQLFAFAKAMQGYFDDIKGLPASVYTNMQIYEDGDFLRYDDEYTYKFVTEETYSKYVSKGSFLLGSLERYRQFELQGDPAGDRFEGSSYCAYSVANRELTAATLSGFDNYIFSSARDIENKNEMLKKFGPIILRIKIRPFAELLSQELGYSYEIRLVQYADLKVHRSSLPLSKVTGFPKHLTRNLARALRTRGRLPAIFGKPYRFVGEREVRIAFPTGKDVPDHCSIKNPKLLDYVERVK
ncbi:hypothetical protein EJV46_07175 [Roseococcus sp. SYP-B2431]|uniref:hypothetical protein n=1 Tax=Roseococcus sp. SYP-B2431 TaxID=2496640 RepID=UPI00103D30EF|nr:hypothetical protein [Roseococcus sp. SYP-B2431]TCI00406.1 hypothetical protein EJV46_07175 [Roseococcus sp. SYP-B2431]